MPVAMIAPSPVAVPNSTAAIAEPTRNTDSVVRRPHTSMSQAATAYPGSWARVISRVNPNDLTRS